MPVRNRKPYEWPLFYGASLLLLLVAPAISGRALAPRVKSEAHQASERACLKRRDLLRQEDGRLRWFSSGELMERVINKQPVDRPGALGANNLRGTVTIRVVINKNGKVICTRGVEGNPLGIASAERSLRKWTFRPYVSGGKRKSIVGTLSISYDFGR